MGVRWLLVMSLAGACGGDDGTVAIDARPHDASELGPPTFRLISFAAGQDRDPARAHLVAYVPAAAVGSAGWCWPEEIVGPCLQQHCVRRSFEGGGPNPGPVTATGDLTSLRVVPDANGHYPQASTDVLFTSGGTVRFTATGGLVPAFDETLRAQQDITLTTPWPAAISRAQPYTATWSGGTGTVHLSIIPAVRGETWQAFCSFDAAAGTGTVPVEVLQWTPADVDAEVMIGTSEHRVVDVGDPAVQLRLAVQQDLNPARVILE